MKSKKIKKIFIPKTNLGKLSLALIVLFFLLIIIFSIIVRIQEPRDDQTFFDNPTSTHFVVGKLFYP